VITIGKNAPRIGKVPSVVLINPKYPRNVGTIQRTCSCFDISQLWWTGKRVTLNPEKGERLPREERMRGYKDVTLLNYDKPLEQFPRGTTPVAIEVRPNCETLPTFVHPENPVYVFGPEDGSIPKQILRLCHRFVIVPTKHCLNLAMTVNVVLYDRMVKLGESFDISTVEDRAWKIPEDNVNKVDGLEIT